MKYERAQKTILPILVFVALIGIWSFIATIVENFPTPSDTYVSAFGGINSEGDEIAGVLADPFYIANEDDKGIFWQILASLET